MFKTTPKKQEQKQFEQLGEFQRFTNALRKILAVPKEELERREEEYQKERKRQKSKAKSS